MVPWIGLCTSIAGGTGSIPGRGRSACPVVWQKKEGELTPVLYTLAQRGLPHFSPQPIDQNQ